MTTIPPEKNGASPAVDDSAYHTDPLRNLVDFLLVIFLAAIIFKFFIAEGYYVPSGSMAPNLLGFHHHAKCDQCGHEFQIGVDEYRGIVAARCPNCRSSVTVNPQNIDAGDRLLVLKWFHELRPPNRWETVVFRNPNDAGQAYIKRVVGLPGEAVAIRNGDVFINGHIARKSLDQLRAIALTVYDHSRACRASECGPRFESEPTESSWRLEGDRLVVDATTSRTIQDTAYVHLGSNNAEIPISDDNPYNGSQSESTNAAVTDLLLDLHARHENGTGWLGIRLQPSRKATLEVRFHPTYGRVELYRDGRLHKSGQTHNWANDEAEITIAYWDRRLAVRLDGKAPFEDIDFDQSPFDHEHMISRPLVFRASQSKWTLDHIVVRRDVHYRSDSGSRDPHQLQENEYYMLGDNSPISNDSRRWIQPAVPASLLVGRPLWVHLPTFAWRGTILGRQVDLAIPDLSRIRRVE